MTTAQVETVQDGTAGLTADVRRRWGGAASKCVLSAGLARLCALTRGSDRTPIAIIDGLVHRGHPCLSRACIDVIEVAGIPGSSSRAASEHATFIASILAGAGPDCLGLAPGCPLVNVPAVDEEMLRGAIPPRLSAARLAAAVEVAAAHGASVLQCSLDLEFDAAEARPLIAAVGAAVDAGAVLVVPAGRHHFVRDNPLPWLPGVLAVTGGDRLRCAQHDLLAPGVDIPGAVLPAGTALRSGTSFAACFVTATVALLCAGGHVAPRDAARAVVSSSWHSPHPLDAEECLRAVLGAREGHSCRIQVQ